MKSTGIVRKVDELGRIVLPIELRRTLDIAEKDAIEIYVDGESIILKKYEPTCIFCGDGQERRELPRQEHLRQLHEGAARRQIRSMQKIPLPDRRRDFCRKSKSTGVCRIETSCGPLLY